MINRQNNNLCLLAGLDYSFQTFPSNSQNDHCPNRSYAKELVECAHIYMDTLIQMVSEVTLNIQFDATIHIDVITFKPYQFAQHQEYPNK